MIPNEIPGAENPMVIDVGHQVADSPVSYDMMFPAVVYAHAGQPITFQNKALFTPHTVTFAGGQPLPDLMDPVAMQPSQPSGGRWDGQGPLSSGMLAPGESYAVTFTAVGVYDYICLMHPMMRGQIVVMPADAPVPTSTAQGQAADLQQTEAEAHAGALMAAERERLPAGTWAGDGTCEWAVTAGMGATGFDIEQFYPSALLVSVGDSVAFHNRNRYEPHFVTFPTSEADRERFFHGHEPNLPALMTPVGGDVVDGRGLVHSGAIGPEQRVTFRFPAIGSFTYDCYLHDGNEMDGLVIVQPLGAYHVYLNGRPFAYSGEHQPYERDGLIFVPVAELVRQLAAGGTRVEASIIDSVTDELFLPVPGLMEILQGRYSYDSATRTLAMWVK